MSDLGFPDPADELAVEAWLETASPEQANAYCARIVEDLRASGDPELLELADDLVAWSENPPTDVTDGMDDDPLAPFALPEPDLEPEPTLTIRDMNPPASESGDSGAGFQDPAQAILDCVNQARAYHQRH